MEKKISSSSYDKYIILLLILFFPFLATAQEAKKDKKKKEDSKGILIDQAKVPLFNGVFIGYDLLGPIYKAYSDDYLSNEIMIDFNLKNRYFPVIELGYGSSDKWSDHGINYKAKAPYVRIGADYNFLYKKQEKNYLTLGLRYAMSKFDYELSNLTLEDGIWGDNISNLGIYDDVWPGSMDLSKTKVASSMQWLEFVVGVRAAIFKNIYMGWSVRMKYKISSKKSDVGNPWYVPGYGIYKDSRFGITYSIIYRLPGKKKK